MTKRRCSIRNGEAGGLSPEATRLGREAGGKDGGEKTWLAAALARRVFEGGATARAVRSRADISPARGGLCSSHGRKPVERGKPDPHFFKVCAVGLRTHRAECGYAAGL
jgi:hypothetical protein